MLRPALDALHNNMLEEQPNHTPEPPTGLRATLCDLFEIGPATVSPHDEANPTWVEEHRDDSVELLELTEALARVDEGERGALIAEHLGVLAELTAHHRTVTGTTGPDGWQIWCPWCVADPESHAASLSYAIVWRTAELVDALGLYGAGVLGEHANQITEALRDAYRSGDS